MGHLNVSIFSIFSSLILFNIAAIIIVVKRKNTAFIAKYSVNLLLISTLLAFLRLLFPIDLYYATLILHVSDDQYELYVNGKFSKTLNSTDIKKPQYSKYEIIERSQ